MCSSDLDSRRTLRQLREAARADRFDEIERQIATIEENLHDDTQANIETYRKEIERSINNDIVLRHGYAQGVVARSLPDDKEVQQAAALLQDPQEYRRILTEQDTRRK